jgi:hypothetical protein
VATGALVAAGALVGDAPKLHARLAITMTEITMKIRILFMENTPLVLKLNYRQNRTSRLKELIGISTRTASGRRIIISLLRTARKNNYD